jgi:glucokinase
MFNVLAMDIGGTNFKVALFDHEGRLLVASEGATERAGGREWMLAQIRERGQALIKQSDFPVRACGVSFGGPVDFARQLVITSHHSPGWDNFPFSSWVADHLGLECRTDNDANAGAWGESRFGAGRGADSMVYITISTGIGAGVVFGGKPYRGRDNLAGELGHVPVSDSGTVCSCGARGCLETFCSGTAIALRAQGFAQRKPDVVPRILELSGDDPLKVTTEMVFQAAAQGESAAINIVNEAARWLARGILMLIRILNPDRIILGGGVAKAGRGLLDPVETHLAQLDSPSLHSSCELAIAHLGDHSPLYGAASMALEVAAPAA